MTIETPLHYAGTLEMIQRLTGLIEYSRPSMLPEDFNRFEADMRKRISELQNAVDLWLQPQGIDLMACSTFTFHSSSENVMTIVRGGPPPLRTLIDSVKIQRPAETAGRCICDQLVSYLFATESRLCCN